MQSRREFTEALRQTLSVARAKAIARGAASVAPEHLLLALLSPEPGGLVAALLDRFGTSGKVLRDKLPIGERRPATRPPERLPFTPEAARALELAAAEAERLGDGSAGPQHLLLGLLQLEREPALEGLRSVLVSPEIARGVLARLRAPV